MLPGEEGRRFSQELGLHPQFADLLLELTEPGPLRKRQRRLVINVLGPIPVDPAPERPLIHVDLTSDLSDRTRCLDHHLHRFFLLEFHHYAAGFSQARRMAWISAGVGCSGRAHRNLAAIRTRRSLASMSAVDGWVFVRYQGARVWRSVTSSGWWPVVAYQQTARVWQASPNGTVRSTAAGRRLRAWPTPINCLASQMATSTDQRVA